LKWPEAAKRIRKLHIPASSATVGWAGKRFPDFVSSACSPIDREWLFFLRRDAQIGVFRTFVSELQEKS
jgi:hypothetical protein